MCKRVNLLPISLLGNLVVVCIDFGIKNEIETIVILSNSIKIHTGIRLLEESSCEINKYGINITNNNLQITHIKNIFQVFFNSTLSFKFYSNIVLYALGLVSSSLFTTTGDTTKHTSHQLYLTSLSETIPSQSNVDPIIFIYVSYIF